MKTHSSICPSFLQLTNFFVYKLVECLSFPTNFSIQIHHVNFQYNNSEKINNKDKRNITPDRSVEHGHKRISIKCLIGVYIDLISIVDTARSIFFSLAQLAQSPLVLLPSVVRKYRSEVETGTFAMPWSRGMKYGLDGFFTQTNVYNFLTREKYEKRQ